MPVAVDSLWSPEIKPTTQSPRSILASQARAITEQTKGILVGNLRVSRDEKKTYLSLDIVVPALENYRHQIIAAVHDLNMIYPVRLEASCFASPISVDYLSPSSALISALNASVSRMAENTASTDEEFRTLVARVLRSDEVKALAQSLIARANEVLAQADKELLTETETANGIAKNEAESDSNGKP